MTENIAPWMDDWHEHEEIDRGGQGIVIELSHKKEPARRAVLKRIVQRWREDPQARKRLQQETEILLKLHDLGAHVPEVYDSFLNHGNCEPFLLMEFIEGIRFDRWLKKSAPVEPAKAVLLTRGVAETIHLCHEHKIGHRDLKPTNIILKNGEISLPYVLDFGIAFDSRQTRILTREGEMFWNEFIILPECQELEGGHRDHRSDITALAGIFFSCLTGQPPRVLLNSIELAPHQRHERLLIDSAKTVDVGERLLWFFDRAFAYRIDERFQTLGEFLAELERFADSSTIERLDLVEQFDILKQTVSSTDRNVQLAVLRKKYAQILGVVHDKLVKELKVLSQNEAQLSISNMTIIGLSEQNKPKLNGGDLLNTSSLSIIVGLEHFQRIAVVLLVAFGVGMQIHFYSASYCAPSNKPNISKKLLDWSKIASLDESSDSISETKLSVIVEALKSKLAREMKNLVREKKG